MYDEKTNPTCVYMEPEAASVGLTEEQCKAKGIDYKVGKFPLVANGKSLIINGGEGLVKIIADAKYEEVLGMHIIGPRATDLIAEGALALRLEATVDELISTIHSHPTVSESVRECALNVQKRAIHIKNLLRFPMTRSAANKRRPLLLREERYGASMARQNSSVQSRRI